MSEPTMTRVNLGVTRIFPLRYAARTPKNAQRVAITACPTIP